MELEFIDTSNPDNTPFQDLDFEQELDNQEFEQDFEQEDQLDEYSSFVDIATSMGFKEEDLKEVPKEITRDQYAQYMKQLFGRQYLQEKAPGLAPLIENGLNMQVYIEQVKAIDETLAFPDENLVKGSLYDHHYKNALQLGTIRPDRNGNISKEDQAYIISKVEADYSRYGDNVTSIANNIRQQLEQQKEELPQKLQEYSFEQYKQVIQSYNNEANQFVNELKNQKEIIFGFTDNKEREDFTNFAKEQLSIVETENQRGVKLIMDLENDGELLKKVLRLLHLEKQGYIKNIKTRATQDAWSKLSKHSPEKGGGAGTKSGGFTFVDTSKPH